MTDSRRDSGPRSSDETLAATPESRDSRPSAAIDGGRFAPGTLLDARYRIVGLLGRGGMGEVYRADDLTLGEPVAIKLLPAELVEDEAALARFHEEVRVARRITHPNVVRVHDIGEIDGVPYLTMEYVAGEDLAGLLRRIGRLPEDKALELARQLCAGLAAAHDNGVLHRDLKPANVMIDHEGRAKIADFGLARLASELGQGEAGAGTPAYMAPEQLTRKAVSEQTDLFALGLVLYEMFTGRRAAGDASAAQMLADRKRPSSEPVSAHVEGLDAQIESVINRCLAPEPAGRPRSALEVSAALPGGDPLARALAAGETPSPEMVAAAPREGRLRPAIGGALAAALVLLLGGALWLRQEVMLLSLAHLPKSGEVLEDRAGTLAAELGYSAEPDHVASGWSMNTDLLAYLRAGGSGADALEGLAANRPPAFRFTYRQSSRPFLARGFGRWEKSFDDVLFAAPGTVELVLDPEGRLLRLRAEPGRGRVAPSRAVSEEVLFAAAGLEPRAFSPVEPRASSIAGVDRRLAWEGELQGWREGRVYVGADFADDRLVRFEVSPPWPTPADEGDFEVTNPAAAVFSLLVWLGALTVGLVLARRHLEAGSADRTGANRLALFMMALSLAQWLFGVAGPGDLVDLGAFLEALGRALLLGAFAWVVYLAFEPFLRRRWPEGVVSWTRLLAGSLRDPLVGRDVLIGTVAGSGAAALVMLHGELLRRLGHAVLGADPGWELFLGGLTDALRGLAFTGQMAVFISLGGIFLFVLFYALTRRKLFASVAYLALWTLFFTGVAASEVLPGFTPVLPLLLAAIVTLVTALFGALSLTACWLVFFLLIYMPTTLDLSAWHSLGTVAAAAVSLGLGGWGWWSTTAHRRETRS